jgi:phosphoribosylamine--glycine ligase
MNVLVIGGGGREHALVWKIAQSPLVSRVLAAPGNPGVAAVEKAANATLEVNDHAGVARFLRDEEISLTVVGPEAPLCAGLVDALNAAGHRVFGPVQAAAQIEGSKAFAKDFMQRFGIPTAQYASFEDFESAADYVRKMGAPIVIKADGLAAGKGVTVARTEEEAIAALRQAMLEQAFGGAGQKVVVEECLVGEEASILAFCDGSTFRTLASSQDHKAVFDGDSGPNTGGMGAYSPAPIVTPELQARIDEEVLRPFVAGMRELGTPYKGIIYAGLMITAEGPKVIEFNCRLGDPETQCVLPRLTCDIVPVMQACIDGTLESTTLRFDDGYCITVVLASGGYPGSFDKGFPITGVDAAEQEGCTVFHAGTVDKDGALRTSGGRVLNVTAKGPTLQEAISRAYAGVEKISFEGVHYRKDIAEKAFRHLG